MVEIYRLNSKLNVDPDPEKAGNQVPDLREPFLQGAKDVKTFGTRGTNRIELDKKDIEYEESSYHIKNDKDHTQEISKTKSMSFDNLRNIRKSIT